MTKNAKIIIGVVAAVTVGFAAFAMSGAGLFQARLSKYVTPKKSYIASVPLCLTPDEYVKKYVNPHNNTGTSTNSDDGTKPVVTIGVPGIGSKGGTVAPGETDSTGTSSGSTATPGDSGAKVVMEHCSCRGKNSSWFVKIANGKNVKHQCYVDPGECVDPDFQCPDGTQVDYPALSASCVDHKKKNCFDGEPDNTSKLDTMCKELTSYSKWTCMTEKECLKYGGYVKDGTLADKIKSGEIKLDDMYSCTVLYNAEFPGYF